MRTACVLLTLAASAGVAAGQSRPSEAPVPSCLNQSIADQVGGSLRPRGVQKRVFTKRGQLALVGHGGLFAGDLTSSSYDVGGSLAWFITEDLGFEVRVDVTRVDLELDAPLSEFFGDVRFDSGVGVVGLGGLLWSPIHAKLKIGDRIVHSDILIAGGSVACSPTTACRAWRSTSAPSSSCLRPDGSRFASMCATSR